MVDQTQSKSLTQKLKGSGSKEDYQLSRKLEAKMRTFAPVIVRGEEKQGVKFWGFGKTVYQELLSIIATLIMVISQTLSMVVMLLWNLSQPKNQWSSFPKTNIRVKPNQTPISDEPDVLELVKTQQDIKEIYQELSYDDLTDVLNEWLNPSEDSSEKKLKKKFLQELSTKVKVSNTGDALMNYSNRK